MSGRHWRGNRWPMLQRIPLRRRLRTRLLKMPEEHRSREVIRAGAVRTSSETEKHGNANGEVTPSLAQLQPETGLSTLLLGDHGTSDRRVHSCDNDPRAVPAIAILK